MLTTALYVPTDLAAAYYAWGANCGPAAFAALLGREVDAVRPYFAGFDARRYVNPTHMKAALAAAGVPHRTVPPKSPGPGLVFVQVDGPWCDPGVPVGVAYRHTHWVAVADGLIFDVNAGAWLGRAAWERAAMSEIVAATPRATGWSLRTRIGVDVPGVAS